MTSDELLTKLDAIAREYYDFGLPLDDPIAEQLRDTVREFVSARDAEIARLKAQIPRKGAYVAAGLDLFNLHVVCGVAQRAVGLMDGPVEGKSRGGLDAIREVVEIVRDSLHAHDDQGTGMKEFAP